MLERIDRDEPNGRERFDAIMFLWGKGKGVIGLLLFEFMVIFSYIVTTNCGGKHYKYNESFD